MITLSPNPSAAELAQAIRLLTEEVRRMDERNLDNIEGWAGNQSNVTTDRTFDANSTTTDELADVLGTLIADLLAKGVLK